MIAVKPAPVPGSDIPDQMPDRRSHGWRLSHWTRPNSIAISRVGIMRV
jgi:hypothetical protein